MKITSRKITNAAAIITVPVAILVLASWIFAVATPGNLFQSIPVKFNTGVCMLLTAIALFILNQPKIRKTIKVIGRACSFAVLLITLLTLAEYIFKTNTGIDNFFWTDDHAGPAALHPGRMTSLASIIFALLNITYLLVRLRRFHLLIQIILAFGFFILSLIFLVYVSRTNDESFSLLKPTSLHTSFALLVLYIGTFCSEPLSYLRFSFQKRMAAYFSLSLLLLVVVFFSFRQTSRRFDDTTRWIEHTNKAILENQHILVLAGDLESNARGYVISGNENYRESFYKNEDAVHAAIRQLKQTTKDNPEQQLRIDSLGKIVDKNISLRKQLMDLRRTGGFAAAEELFSTDITKNAMKELRQVISNIETDEKQLLDKRSNDNQQSINATSKVGLLFQIVAATLLLAAFFIIYNNTKRRNKAEAEIKLWNETLEIKVEEKTSELLKNELHFRKILDNLLEGAQIIGFDWKYIYVNEAFLKHSKYSKEELIGYTVMEKYPGIEQAPIFPVYERCFKGRVAIHLENEFVFPDGQLGWFELSFQPVPEGLFILSVDITERKRAENAVAASEKQYRTLIDSTNEIIYQLDANGNLVFANNSFKQLLEYNDDEILKLTTWDIIHEDKHQELNERWKNLRPDTTSISTDWILKSKSGRKIYTEGNVVRHFSNNVFSGAEVFFRDITERKNAEAKMLQLNETLDKRAKELLSSNTELERFAYVASHDLQEPLRMVSSFLHLLERKLEGTLDESGKQYIDFAVDGAGRMKNLIEDLLQYSRLGTSKDAVSDVDCNEIMELVRSMLALSIKETDATLEVHPLPTIPAVRSQLLQLFQNLISNALKYHGSERPVIEIGCEEQNDVWEFYVKDNGIGIDPKFFDKIFVIFQRLHNKTDYSGTGIGLSICKKIIEKHGGTIWVASDPGKGTTFYFTLPKTRS